MDGVWCFGRLLYRFFGVMRSVVASCGVPSPFYNGPFFPLEGAPVTSLGQGPSPLTDHFCSSQDTSFPLFQGRNFFRPYFCSFSCSRRIVCMILAYFSRLLSSAISSLFLGKARTLMEFIEEHGCIKCLVLRRKKTVSWFACTHMVTRIKLW
jgi:hypothetical protein